MSGPDQPGEDGLRVALLNPCYWPEVRRGSERFARELADGLIARGRRARLITSHRGLPSTTVEDGLEVVRNWRPPPRRLRWRDYQDFTTHLRASERSLSRGDDDVAHALYPTDALAALRWKRRSGRPVVFSHMGIPHPAAFAAKLGHGEATRIAARDSDAVVALSRTAAEGFERWLGVRARVIHPGVDLTAFTPAPEREPEPTIVCASDLQIPRKRVGLLIEAFALVRRERPTARLVLSRPRDPAQAPRQDGVEFADLDDRAALARTNGGAWVAALPSTGEAFGLVAVEALACGTPVVGSAREALPEVIDSPAIGRLFEGDEPLALARALLECLELAQDPGTAAACRARAQDFSTDRCTESYVSLYREIGA